MSKFSTLLKAAIGERANHKYLRKEGGKYIYEEPKEKEKSDVEGLEKKPDGFYYHGSVKVTKDKEKAKAYIEHEKQNSTPGSPDGKVEIKPGTRVRIKANAKSGIFRETKGRGIIARVIEVGKDLVRIADEAGRTFRVRASELEYAKSKKISVEETIMKVSNLKEALELKKSGTHKYIKREGGKGKYKYTYRDFNKEFSQTLATHKKEESIKNKTAGQRLNEAAKKREEAHKKMESAIKTVGGDTRGAARNLQAAKVDEEIRQNTFKRKMAVKDFKKQIEKDSGDTHDIVSSYEETVEK